MTHVLLGLALAVGAPAPKEKEKEKPPQKLEGTWVVEKIEGKDDKDGDPLPTFTFADGKVSIKEAKRDKPEEASYTTDMTKKPAEMDIRPDRGAKDIVVPGIYEIDGDTLKLCFSHHGRGDRPKEFKADPEKGVVLVVLKRMKEK